VLPGGEAEGNRTTPLQPQSILHKRIGVKPGGVVPGKFAVDENPRTCGGRFEPESLGSHCSLHRPLDGGRQRSRPTIGNGFPGCASASYIAVPAVQQLAIPEASPTPPVAASIGLTFSYNVTIGIPVYIQLATLVTERFRIGWESSAQCNRSHARSPAPPTSSPSFSQERDNPGAALAKDLRPRTESAIINCSI
jgi:hypothetical protein